MHHQHQQQHAKPQLAASATDGGTRPAGDSPGLTSAKSPLAAVASGISVGAGSGAAAHSQELKPLSLESHLQFVQGVVQYLDLKSVQALCAANRCIKETIELTAGPQGFTIGKPTSPLDAAPGSSCFKTFQRWGGQLQSLSVSRMRWLMPDE